MPPAPPPAPRIIQNTVHQTVVHLHQTTHQHILRHLSTAGDGRGNTTLLVRQTALPPSPDNAADESRPALAARRMLRILSTESARQTLRPFYRDLLHELLEQEREAYRGKPERSLLLVQGVLGRHQMLTTLHRLYQRTTEELDGSIFHRLICRRYVRHIRQEESEGLVQRYTSREVPVPEDLRRLPAAKRLPSLPPPPEPQADRTPPPESPRPAPPVGGLHLSGSDFQILVRGVADALSRQSRLDSLRRGGM